MPHLSNKSAQSLLDNIPDSSTRRALSDILKGEIVYQVKCLSEECAGRIIGFIHKSGRVEGTQDEQGFMWLRSSRDRLDNFKGFECWCGNDSRLSPQEKGIIDEKGNPPTKSGLEKIWENLQNEPSNYPEQNGSRMVDGFLIEEM